MDNDLLDNIALGLLSAAQSVSVTYSGDTYQATTGRTGLYGAIDKTPFVETGHANGVQDLLTAGNCDVSEVQHNFAVNFFMPFESNDPAKAMGVLSRMFIAFGKAFYADTNVGVTMTSLNDDQPLAFITTHNVSIGKNVNNRLYWRWSINVRYELETSNT